MINQLIARSFMLCAFLIPSLSTAMEQKRNFEFPIQQNRFEKYVPIGTGLAVGAGILLYSKDSFIETVKAHPFRALGTLTTTVAGLWMLQDIRSINQKKAPLIRNQDGARSHKYSIPCILSVIINGGLYYSNFVINPLFWASTCSLGAAACVGDLYDEKKDNKEAKYVQNTNNLATAILTDAGRDALSVKNNNGHEPAFDRNATQKKLVVEVEKLDVSRRNTWFDANTMDLYNHLKKPTIVSSESINA